MTSQRHTTPQDRPAPSPGDRFWPALEAEPAAWTMDHFRQLAVNAAHHSTSDITVQTDRPVTVQIAGRQMAATRRPLTQSEVQTMLTGMYASGSAPSLLAQLRVLDFSWEVSTSRARRLRFRVNATAILARRGGNGVEISMRALPDRTPSPADVGLAEPLCEMLSPPSGLVVVAGATGQGKSTTLAALIGRHIAHARAVKIVDIQAPIEFTYSDLQTAETASSIGQSEVGIHVESFAAGVRSALRRSPDIIMIGEVRDWETARAAVDAALTGHLVLTTLHAGDVPEIFHRLAALLAAGPGTQETATVDILQTLRAGMAQRLLPTSHQLGRAPIREVVILDTELRRKLRKTHPEQWPAAMAAELAEQDPDNPPVHRRPFQADLRALQAQGMITAEQVQLHLQ